jgi:hypothetical protein
MPCDNAIFLGDYLKAVRSLAVEAPDEKTELAALLGFAPIRRSEQPIASPDRYSQQPVARERASDNGSKTAGVKGETPQLQPRPGSMTNSEAFRPIHATSGGKPFPPDPPYYYCVIKSCLYTRLT